MRRLAAVLLLLSTLTAAADTTERLSTIARVWGAVKFTHPFLGYREDIDWDAAGVAAAERARGSEPVERIVADMLAALGDPMTRVAPRCADAAVTPPAPSGDPLVIPLATLTASQLDPALADAIRSARVIVFDLRSGSCSMPSLPLLASIEPLLFGAAYELPAERYVSHRGYRSQDPEFESSYGSDFATTARSVSGAAGANAGAFAVFVTNDRTALPPLALAMIRAGRGKVVSVGPFGEEAAVSHVRVAVGEGHQAIVRAGELNVAGNAFSILPAVTLPASASAGEAIAAAIETTQPSRRRRSATAPSTGRALPPYNFRREPAYAAMAYPGFGYRALAAFRLWNTIEYFYGYPHLIGDWDARLPEVVNLLTSASSQREYDLALAKAMTWVPDGHSQVFAPGWLDLRGRSFAPFALMPVEGKPVVVELIDAAASGPVALGDELLAIDGRPAAERYAELNEYVSGSHEAARAYYITSSLPNGAAGEAAYTFRKPNGETYEARILRAAYARVAPAKPWRILEGNIGYVDLRWLEATQVNQMVTELMTTRGLIFDIRNYPRGVFPVLALRFNTTGGPATVAAFRVPLLKGGRGDVEQFNQTLSSSTQPKYTGKTVALINERAQSQSEHTCLVLEALSNTTFVGSPTVGANGNITMMVMPGGIYIMFTGMDVRHLDGRQLQRVGIVPHVDVPRTIDAFRQGRDEVLERAVEMLGQ